METSVGGLGITKTNLWQGCQHKADITVGIKQLVQYWHYKQKLLDLYYGVIGKKLSVFHQLHKLMEFKAEQKLLF